MNKLTDLRFIIGSFFSIVGLVLVGTSFYISNSFDLWTGGVMVVFGGGMLGSSVLDKEDGIKGIKMINIFYEK